MSNPPVECRQFSCEWRTRVLWFWMMVLSTAVIYSKSTLIKGFRLKLSYLGFSRVCMVSDISDTGKRPRRKQNFDIGWLLLGVKSRHARRTLWFGLMIQSSSSSKLPWVLVHASEWQSGGTKLWHQCHNLKIQKTSKLICDRCVTAIRWFHCYSMETTPRSKHTLRSKL